MIIHNVSYHSHALSEKILDSLIQVVHKATFIDNQPVNLGIGSSLSAAEIHLIDMAGRFSGETISGLASRLGVTKGAVSQMVNKLEEKGYLIKIHGEGNKKNVFIELTKNGKMAYDWHDSLHKHMNQMVLTRLSQLNQEESEKILAIFLDLSAMLDLSIIIRDEHIRRFLNEYTDSAL
jgi:DNA-binding MarR family transcriptional regulator